jgi:hypothetical protein
MHRVWLLPQDLRDLWFSDYQANEEKQLEVGRQDCGLLHENRFRIFFTGGVKKETPFWGGGA